MAELSASGETISVDTQDLPINMQLSRVGDMYTVFGEALAGSGGRPTVRARLARVCHGLDLDLYQRALQVKVRYDARDCDIPS